MDEIKDFLYSKGYTLVEIEDEYHYIFSKTIEEIDMIFCLIAPHSGNYYCYVLRGEAVELFDKWSNVTFEREYSSIEDFKMNYGKWLFCGTSLDL